MTRFNSPPPTNDSTRNATRIWLIVALVLSSSFGCSRSTKQAEPMAEAYTGTMVNLMESQVFKLYRGDQKELLTEHANADTIADIVTGTADQWWLETVLDIPKQIRDDEDIWLYLHSTLPAVEVSLNRHVLFRTGSVGDKAANQRTGRAIVYHQIPRVRIKTGDRGRSANTLTLRFSNFQFHRRQAQFDLAIGPAQVVEQKIGPHIYGPLFLAGVFLLATCLNLAFFFAFRKKPVFMALTALYSFCTLVMVLTLYQYHFRPNMSLVAVTELHTLESIALFGLLVWVLLIETKLLERVTIRPVHSAMALVAMILPTLFAILGWLPLFLSLIPVTVAWLAWRQRLAHGGVLASTSLVICLFTWISQLSQPALTWSIGFTSLVTYLDYGGVAIFAIVMVVLSTKQIIVNQQQLHETQLKSARLENELLQKHLQPHFLNNSLMALQHLIHTDRDQAGRMVEALSEKLHWLNQCRQRTLIPLDDELALCRAHLGTMSLQQSTAFKLETVGLSGCEQVPPAMFFTLLENGLTHGYSGRQGGVFRLQKHRKGQTLIYRFSNDGDTQSSAGASHSGTGLSYVRARLAESYPGRWQLTSRATADGWETIVTIEDEP